MRESLSPGTGPAATKERGRHTPLPHSEGDAPAALPCGPQAGLQVGGGRSSQRLSRQLPGQELWSLMVSWSPGRKVTARPMAAQPAQSQKGLGRKHRGHGAHPTLGLGPGATPG